MAQLATISTPTRTLADIISGAMHSVSIASGQAYPTHDACTVATILANLGWTSATTDAQAEVEAMRGRQTTVAGLLDVIYAGKSCHVAVATGCNGYNTDYSVSFLALLKLKASKPYNR